MPCFSVRETSVAFTAKSLETLKKALEDMGLSVTDYGNGVLAYTGKHKGTGLYHSGSYSDGQFRTDGRPLNVEEVKISYAAALVKSQWGKLGKVTQKSATKFVVQLRSH